MALANFTSADYTSGALDAAVALAVSEEQALKVGFRAAVATLDKPYEKLMVVVSGECAVRSECAIRNG